MTNIADGETPDADRIPIDLNQPIMLVVHNPNGDVTVRAAERTDVLISHITPGLSDDLGEEADLIIDVQDNRIEVRANPHPGTGWAGVSGEVDLEGVVGQITKAFRRGGSWASAKPGKMHVATGHHSWFDITIEVPHAVTGRVEIHTASGDVRIEDVTTEIALHSVSGDARVARTEGDLVLQTVSGDLIVERSKGRLTAHTASGDVRITSGQIDGFEIQTANGDILLDALLAGDGPFRAHTVSGDVVLTLQRPAAVGEETAATLAFQTVSGDAHVTGPFRKTDRWLWQAGSGDRGPRIEVKTVSGDLAAGLSPAVSDFVRTAAPSVPTVDVPPAPPLAPEPVIAPIWPSPPTEPAPPTMLWSHDEIEPAASAGNSRSEASLPEVSSDAARLAVLEAVERGEIDVEEALRQLEATDSLSNP